MKRCTECGKPLSLYLKREDGKKQPAHLHLLFAGMCIAHRHECACGHVVVLHEPCGYRDGANLAAGWSHARSSDYANES